MYKDIFSLIEQSMSFGGKYIAIEENHTIVVSLRDFKHNVYFAYTVGYENRDFLYYLNRYCFSRGIIMVIKI